MPRRPSRRFLWIAAAVLVVALIAVRLFAPESIAVSVAPAEAGPFEVTIDEDGRTRAVDRYVVTSPIAGELERVALRVGETVAAGDVIARVLPPPLDERTRAQLRATLDAAIARQRSAEATRQQAEAAADQARRELERRRSLVQAGAISAEQLEQFTLAAQARADEAAAARQAAAAASADTQAARAALLGGTGSAIAVRAPAAGTIATIPERSGRIVAPGEIIAEITDPGALEVVVDVLSADAVRIEPGHHATLTDWGGDEPLRAVVRRVEPSAFTRISALGVEEQRVNVILDLLERPALLGDDYRVEAAIRVWHGENVVTVPSSAVFRAAHGDGWRVFRVVDGRAVLTDVTAAQRSGARTRITAGLDEGDTVVLFPPDDLDDGMRLNVAR